jgi:hypothetical protein
VRHNQSGDAAHIGLQERDSPIPRAEGSKMMVAVERKRVSPPGAKELAASAARISPLVSGLRHVPSKTSYATWTRIAQAATLNLSRKPTLLDG